MHHQNSCKDREQIDHQLRLALRYSCPSETNTPNISFDHLFTCLLTRVFQTETSSTQSFYEKHQNAFIHQVTVLPWLPSANKCQEKWPKFTTQSLWGTWAMWFTVRGKRPVSQQQIVQVWVAVCWHWIRANSGSDMRPREGSDSLGLRHLLCGCVCVCSCVCLWVCVLVQRKMTWLYSERMPWWLVCSTNGASLRGHTKTIFSNNLVCILRHKHIFVHLIVLITKIIWIHFTWKYTISAFLLQNVKFISALLAVSL